MARRASWPLIVLFFIGRCPSVNVEFNHTGGCGPEQVHQSGTPKKK
jgi:hypothetical protein